MGKKGYKRLPFLRRGINASLFFLFYLLILEAAGGRNSGLASSSLRQEDWEPSRHTSLGKMLQILKKMFDIVLKNGIFVPLEPREGPPSRPRAGPPSRASCRRGNPASTSRCSRGHRAGTPAGFPFSGFVPFSSIFSRICNIFLRICNRFLRKC